MRFILFFMVILLSNLQLSGQELNFKVSVVVQTSNTADPDLFNSLEKNISDFFNNNRWTEDDFQAHEKIRGTFQINISAQPQPNVFQAEIILQTERPVFNSSYSTPIISLIDKNVSFSYDGLRVLQQTTVTFYDNLSSILSYYAYLSLGMDYDSFKLNGGDPYFSKAQGIITSLPSNYIKDNGWEIDGSTRRNRYWMIENLLNPRMRQFRQAFYEYHRLSLDKMYEESERSRAILLSALTSMGQANLDYPNSYLLFSFGDAKKDEIVEIFKAGDRGQKNKVSTIMVGIDASKKDKYNALD